MSRFLDSTFNRSLLKSDPVVPEIGRVVRVCDDGSEVVSYEPIDLASIKQSNGIASNWNISSLIKAGVNPENIQGHSMSASRLDSQAAVSGVADQVDKFFDSIESSSESE